MTEAITSYGNTNFVCDYDEDENLLKAQGLETKLLDIDRELEDLIHRLRNPKLFPCPGSRGISSVITFLLASGPYAVGQVTGSVLNETTWLTGASNSMRILITALMGIIGQGVIGPAAGRLIFSALLGRFMAKTLEQLFKLSTETTLNTILDFSYTGFRKVNEYFLTTYPCVEVKDIDLDQHIKLIKILNELPQELLSLEQINSMKNALNGKSLTWDWELIEGKENKPTSHHP